MALTLLGTDQGDLYPYPSYWEAGPTEVFDPVRYRLHKVVTSGSSWTITFTVHNGDASAIPAGTTTDTVQGYTQVVPSAIAPGADGDIVITFFPGDYAASSASGAIDFLNSWVWFSPGDRQDPPHVPNWATGWKSAPTLLPLIGGHGAFEVDQLAVLWGSSRGPTPFGTPDYGDYTYAGVPLLIPPLAGGGWPAAIESVSVTNGAGGWSVDIGEWRDFSSGDYAWCPRVTYTAPGNDPVPSSWTYVDVALRDDWTIVDLSSWTGGGMSDQFMPDDVFADGAAPHELLVPIDEGVYPLSVGRKTSRFIAYHGTAPAVAGGLIHGSPLGPGVGGLIVIR